MHARLALQQPSQPTNLAMPCRHHVCMQASLASAASLHPAHPAHRCQQRHGTSMTGEGGSPDAMTGVAMKPPPAGTVLKYSADRAARVALVVTGTRRLFRPCRSSYRERQTSILALSCSVPVDMSRSAERAAWVCARRMPLCREVSAAKLTPASDGSQCMALLRGIEDGESSSHRPRSSLAH